MRAVKLLGIGVALVAGDSGRVGLAQPDCTVTVQPGQSIQVAST